ncbi:MAG: hypothetical protein IJO48_05435 [Clostridia bacterium]|nr:hypothetical protein [Clostridia bacterium]
MAKMTKNHFQIADISINIDTWCELPPHGWLEKFCAGGEQKNNADILVSVDIGTLPSKDGLECVFESPKMRVYNDKESTYRFYTDGMESEFGEYACTRYAFNEYGRYFSTVHKDKADAVPTMKYVLDILPIDTMMTAYERVILHSSYIVHNGGAVLFTGPSGMGKSTQAMLWQQHVGAEIINGDRAVLGKNEHGQWMAYGLPYCGSSKICENVTVPVRAIVVLKQSKENTLVRLSHSAAFRSIYSELTVSKWDMVCMNRAIDTAMGIACEVPVYLLSCVKDISAVELLKKEIERAK